MRFSEPSERTRGQALAFIHITGTTKWLHTASLTGSWGVHYEMAPHGSWKVYALTDDGLALAMGSVLWRLHQAAVARGFTLDTKPGHRDHKPGWVRYVSPAGRKAIISKGRRLLVENALGQLVHVKVPAVA